MRSAARRAVANLSLTVRLTGAPVRNASRCQPGPTHFDGNIRCSAGNPALDKECAFRVIRDLQQQSAEIWITRPTQRDAPFLPTQIRGGKFAAAGIALPGSARMTTGMSQRRREHYFIPDALIHGG
ncbi:MAG: hypothetical protein HT580_12405 [Dechloromonas sp.]|nr:MAG: hypothetical protein HT580_12405 [Dechloromonas sp.]